MSQLAGAREELPLRLRCGAFRHGAGARLAAKAGDSLLSSKSSKAALDLELSDPTQKSTAIVSLKASSEGPAGGEHSGWLIVRFPNTAEEIDAV